MVVSKCLFLGTAFNFAASTTRFTTFDVHALSMGYILICLVILWEVYQVHSTVAGLFSFLSLSETTTQGFVRLRCLSCLLLTLYHFTRRWYCICSKPRYNNIAILGLLILAYNNFSMLIQRR